MRLEIDRRFVNIVLTAINLPKEDVNEQGRTVATALARDQDRVQGIDTMTGNIVRNIERQIEIIRIMSEFRNLFNLS